MTRIEFETALDAGKLETRISTREGDKWYLVRRNGRTQTWKRDTRRFEIPIKFRFRDTMRVKSRFFASGEINEWFRIIPAVSEDATATRPPLSPPDFGE
jgi:hypothetical protein